MRRIVCFGEALIDFVNTGQRRAGELSLNTFTQFPGGAPANVAVAAAKLGSNAAFAGQVGDDSFGHFLIDALQRYGVDTSFTAVHPTAKTAVAFVFIDDAGERSFAFRRDGTADLIIDKNQVHAHWFMGEPIVHLCSNSLTDDSIAEVTRHVVSLARSQSAIISFDVNLRHNLWPLGRVDEDTVTDVVRQADIVKFSREEIDYLSGGKSTDYLDSCFAAGLSAALITDGPRAISIHTGLSHARVEPPQVKAADTTGAGDAFVGAMLYGLSRQSDPLDYLTDIARLRQVAEFAAQCGALAVTKQGAFPSFPTFDQVSNHWIAQG